MNAQEISKKAIALQDMYNVYVYERIKEQYRERDRLLEEDTKEGEMTTDTRETKKTCRKP